MSLISINVAGFKGKTFLVVVREDATVDELRDKVFEKMKGDMSLDTEVDAVHLHTLEREILHHKGHRITDYQLVDKSTITVAMGLLGGASRLTPIPGLIGVTYEQPDMISLDDSPSEARAVMPCGHVISPPSMINYCLGEVQKGRYIFVCPDPGCKSIWKSSHIRHVVGGFDDEKWMKIETKATENRMYRERGYQQCPGCRTWCIPLNSKDVRLRCRACSKGRTFEFCWACQQEWKGTGDRYCGNLGCDGKDPRIRVLSTAEKKVIDSIPGCPSIRACPKCGLLINHIDKCRHMTCISCTTEFCFICLKPWSWPTIHRLTHCVIAPFQTTLGDALWEQRNADAAAQTPRTSGNNSSCVIL